MLIYGCEHTIDKSVFGDTDSLYYSKPSFFFTRFPVFWGVDCSYTIASVIIPVPPLVEQDAIMRFLADESAKFDTLTTEAQRAITLLQERRSALISAAVTGQIDVRQLVATEAT